MNNKPTTTDQLMQKIVERQAELTAISTTIFKARIKKENKVRYTWFEEFKNENNVFNLSKAV